MNEKLDIKERPKGRGTYRTPDIDASNGNDEVDNVMSKYSHHMDEFINRRGRSASPFNEKEDDNESDESGKGQENLIILKDACYKRKNKEIYNRSPEDISIKHLILDQEKQNNTINFSYKNILWVLCIFVTIIISYYQFVLPYLINNNNSIYYNESNFNQDMTKIEKEYNINSDSIIKIRTGITTIYNKKDTGAFIFVYKSDGEKFDAMKLFQIIDVIAIKSAKLLRNHTQSVKHINIVSSELNMKNHTELINTYREPVTKSGVMVVENMEDIPSNLAMAFHYYCDEYNPLVERSAIFFTLDVAKCTNSSG